MLVAPVVCFDFSRHTCIVVRVTEKKIFYIAMASEGLGLTHCSPERFSQDWKPSAYPVGKAASTYLNSTITASEGAEKQLLQLKDYVSDGEPFCPGAELTDPITGQLKEIDDMATAKKKPAAKKPAAKKPAAKKPAAKKPAAKKLAVVTKEPSARKPGVTMFIKEQLLKGKDTEDICMGIAEKFPASKAGTKEVSWCRSQLKKEGAL